MISKTLTLITITFFIAFNSLSQSVEPKYLVALDSINNVIKYNPNDTNAYYFRAQLYDFNLFKPELALEDYNMVINLDPKDLDAYFYRGQVFFL